MITVLDVLVLKALKLPRASMSRGFLLVCDAVSAEMSMRNFFFLGFAFSGGGVNKAARASFLERGFGCSLLAEISTTAESIEGASSSRMRAVVRVLLIEVGALNTGDLGAFSGFEYLRRLNIVSV